MTKVYCLSWTVASISSSGFFLLYFITCFSIDRSPLPYKGAAPSRRPSVSAILVCRLRVRSLTYILHYGHLLLPVDTSLHRNLYIFCSMFLIYFECTAGSRDASLVCTRRHVKLTCQNQGASRRDNLPPCRRHEVD